MGAYRLKMQAIQFTGSNINEIWDAFGTTGIYGPTETNPDYLLLTTLNGSLIPCHSGDWVVKDWKSDTFLPVSDDNFHKMFEPYPNVY